MIEVLENDFASGNAVSNLVDELSLALSRTTPETRPLRNAWLRFTIHLACTAPAEYLDSNVILINSAYVDFKVSGKLDIV